MKYIAKTLLLLLLLCSILITGCASKGCGQAFYFVNGIETSKLKVGTAIAYFPPSAGKIDPDDWDVIQGQMEKLFNVPKGYVAIIPVNGLGGCFNLTKNYEESLDMYHVFNIDIILDKESEAKK